MAEFRACDYCGQEQVELVFRNQGELELFKKHGNLPEGKFSASLALGICEAKNGKFFYFHALDLNIVICNKCLLQPIDGHVLSEKSHLIKEAFDRLTRLIPEREEALETSMKWLSRERAELFEAEQAMKDRKEQLNVDRRLHQELSRRMKATP